MLEFASRNRPSVPDDRFTNIGGQYQAAKRLMSQPFTQPSKEHKATVKASTRPSAKVRAFGKQVDRLLAEPISEPSRPRPRSRSARRFALADQYHMQGNVIEAQKQERLAHEQGRDEYISYLAGQAAKRAGGHDI